MTSLDGIWRVERDSGVLPPFGIGKRIRGDSGWTTVGGLPAAPFRVAGRTLVYRGLAVRDELQPRKDGTWSGRGILLGRELCRFRLVPVRSEQPPGAPLPSNE